ncbi:MAG: hypothetical protein AAFR64_07640 [Pseudomonadota bacterium]
MMKNAPLYLVVASAALTVTSPALACDLHGPGQLGGFHRYNPFASAMGDFPELPKAPQEDTQDKAEKSAKKSEKTKKEDKRRQEVLEETPKREWERDYGNGAITEADKATFT